MITLRELKKMRDDGVVRLTRPVSAEWPYRGIVEGQGHGDYAAYAGHGLVSVPVARRLVELDPDVSLSLERA